MGFCFGFGFGFGFGASVVFCVPWLGSAALNAASGPAARPLPTPSKTFPAPYTTPPTVTRAAATGMPTTHANPIPNAFAAFNPALSGGSGAVAGSAAPSLSVSGSESEPPSSVASSSCISYLGCSWYESLAIPCKRRLGSEALKAARTVVVKEGTHCIPTESYVMLGIGQLSGG